MRTHVIILAQGNQSRLPRLKTPKQLLPLPACGGMAILDRTINQVCQLAERDQTNMVITVVADRDIRTHLQKVGLDSPHVLSLWQNEAAGETYFVSDNIRPSEPTTLTVLTLEKPGNSSLKGIAKVLSISLATQADVDTDLMVVLLGDVIYSWHCLEVLLASADVGRAFVGTSDLGASGGEIWGVRWKTSLPTSMLFALEQALANHPPFYEYQPGQMRRWLFALEGKPREEGGDWPSFIAVDDYTRDVDIPEHLELIPEISHHAALDDADHGLVYRTTT